MFSTNLKRPLATVLISAGLLAVAGPAGATTPDEPNALTAAHLKESGGRAEAHTHTGEDSWGYWPL